MNTQTKINQVKTAANMVEVEAILNSITSDYLTKYSIEIEAAPKADNYGSQSDWIKAAVRHFVGQIHSDKKTVWAAIPARFQRTEIYKRLALSQFLTYPVS